MTVICFDDAPCPSFDNHDELCPRSLPWRGVPSTAAADFHQAFLHIRQTIAARQPMTVGWLRGRLLARRPLKTATVVGDYKHEAVRAQFQGKTYFGGLRVFHHIVQPFLECEENIVPDLRRQRQRRQVQRRIQAATNSSRGQEVLREPALPLTAE